MPHLILEYTDNIDREVHFRDLFLRLHTILSDHGISMANCKSRSVPLHSFLVGDGRTNGYFVHLELRFLEGRSTKTKQAIGEAMRTVLREFFSPDAFPGLQITIEVLDIERKSYFKWPDNLS